MNNAYSLTIHLNIMKNNICYTLIAFLLISHFSFAQEAVEKHPLLTDKFVFTGGLFLPNKELTLSVNGNSNSGDIQGEIDLGDVFDFVQFQRTFDIGFDWRFAKKWKLSADFFRTNTVRRAALDEPIEWGDYVFDGAAELGVDIIVLRTMVSRVISRGDKHEFGAGIGFHIMPVSIYIEGEATLIDPDGEEQQTGLERQNVSVTAPLPDFGIYYNWAPTSKWYFEADVDFLYVAIGDYKGWLWDFSGGVKYQIVDFFGVGVNYKYFSVDLEVDKGNDVGSWNGSAGISYNGPMFLVHFNF